MKKKMIVILALALALSAANAFAISSSSALVPTISGFNPTNKVKAAYIGNAAGSAWGAVAAHAAGDKEYWTSSAFGGIAYKTVVPGDSNGGTATGAPNTPTDSTVASGYTTL